MAYINPAIAASSTTFSQLQACGPSGHLENLIAANSTGTAAPAAAPTVVVGAGGGALAPGKYYLAITETNGLGETTIGPASAQFTVSAGQTPTATFPPLQSGNTARNVYLTPANGAPGTMLLYADGIAAANFSLTAAAPTGGPAVPPPSTNTACLSIGTVRLLRLAKSGRLQKAWDFLHKLVSEFNEGAPVPHHDVLARFRDAHAVFALLSQLCAEEGALIAPNPGRMAIAPTPIGGAKPTRTWS